MQPCACAASACVLRAVLLRAVLLRAVLLRAVLLRAVQAGLHGCMGAPQRTVKAHESNVESPRRCASAVYVQQGGGRSAGGFGAGSRQAVHGVRCIAGPEQACSSQHQPAGSQQAHTR
jgi:hypothetical protein